jgi:Tol biopolymer transport system component
MTMFSQRTLLYGVAALALFALAVTAGKGGKPKPPPEPPPAADPAILYSMAGEIWVMNEDGTNQTPIITDAQGLSGHEAGWSVDNGQIVFLGSPAYLDYGLYVADVDGSNVTRIHTLVEGSARPDWSPHALPGGGEWILFHDWTGSATDLFAIRPDGTGLVNLTATTYRTESDPAVSFDGTYVVFKAVTYGDGEPSRVYVGTLGTDASGVPVISSETCLTDVSGSPLVSVKCVYPAVDPTGAYVAVQTVNDNADDDHDLWIIPLASPAVAWRVPLDTGVEEYTPAWLDGRTLVYSRKGTKRKDRRVIAKADIFSGAETIIASGGRTALLDPATRR